MKPGTILHINHSAYGQYAIVKFANRDWVTTVSDRSLELIYGVTDAAKFTTVGRLTVGDQYSTLKHKFRRCTLERPAPLVTCRIDVRVDADDGTIETSIPVIRLMAFAQWVGGAQ